MPPQVPNGHHVGPEIPVNGSVYNYECDNGYFLYNNTKNSAMCTDNGMYTWKTDFKPVCAYLGKLIYLI